MPRLRLWALIVAIVAVFNVSVFVLYFYSVNGVAGSSESGAETELREHELALRERDIGEDVDGDSSTERHIDAGSGLRVNVNVKEVVRGRPQHPITPTSAPKAERETIKPAPTSTPQSKPASKSKPKCEANSAISERAFHVYDIDECAMPDQVTSPHPADILKVAHQHFVHRVDSEVAKAKAALGECYYNFRLNWCFHPGGTGETGGIGPWHQGGPRKVINNLASGLREIGFEWSFCDYDFGKYNVTYLSDPYFMTEAHVESDPKAPSMFKSYGGNRVYIGPNIEDRIMADVNFHHGNLEKLIAVSASEWHMHSRGLHSECVSQGRFWPVGVDTRCFTPGKKEERTEILVMTKHRDADAVLSYLKSNNIAHTLMSYGGYHEKDFIDNLKRAKMCILIDGSETQGLANQEMMAMDVPILVLEHTPTSVPYFSDDVGIITSEEKFGDNFKLFMGKVEAGEFHPRKYVMENLSMSQAAIDLLLMLCDKPNRWQPNHVSGSDRCIPQA